MLLTFFEEGRWVASRYVALVVWKRSTSKAINPLTDIFAKSGEGAREIVLQN
jgi:hypothetical protein